MHQQSCAALLGALLAMPLGALAQHSPRTPDPADPAAPVAPIVYASALTHRAPEPAGGTPTPDKLWRTANEAVAGPSTHSTHSAHSDHSANSADPAHQAAPPPAVPAPARRPAHAGHGAHHPAEASR